ncbi:MAG: TetR/AcrR family transcriptional regulator [Pseudomonadota bacterium]
MDRKTEILDSAEKLARRHGYDGFSYADLERVVGIRKASIHHHFPSKAELAEALVRRYTDRMRAELSRISVSHSSAARRLRDYLAVYQKALKGGEALCLCVVFSAGSQSLSDPVVELLKQYHDDSIDWLSGLFAQAAADQTIANVGEPKREAIACLALVEGAQLLSRASRSEIPFEEATQQMMARIID